MAGGKGIFKAAGREDNAEAGQNIAALDITADDSVVGFPPQAGKYVVAAVEYAAGCGALPRLLLQSRHPARSRRVAYIFATPGGSADRLNSAESRNRAS